MEKIPISLTENTPYKPVLYKADFMIPMSDGVKLATDIYRPAANGVVIEEKLPIVLQRTPYNKRSKQYVKQLKYLVRRGYIAVIQDCRGRYQSEGSFIKYTNEPKDGYETIEWLAGLPYTNGNVGTMGLSYGAHVQACAAKLNPPHLMTSVLNMGGTSNGWDHSIRNHGAFTLKQLTWAFLQVADESDNPVVRDMLDIEKAIHWFQALPLKKGLNPLSVVPNFEAYIFEMMTHSDYDDYWKEVSIEEKYEKIKVPALIMGGWYDLYSKQTFVNYNGMVHHGGTEEARSGTKMIMGAWPHPLSASTTTGEVDFGEDSKYDLEGMEIRWLDYWLKGIDNGIINEAPIKLFIMGANYWRDECEWPLARTRYVNYYFHSSGRANSLFGDGILSPKLPGDEPKDRYTYDPDNPVPTLGGNNCCSPDIVAWGAYDQRPAEKRNDVLIYTTPPLAEDIEVTGPICVKLYASSSTPDTDFTAKLVDVFPDGYAMNLCDGIIRARYRKSFEEAKLMKPDTVYEFTIDCWVTGNVFKAGHRIRVDISSSNFPRFDRNPNTGHEFGMDSELSIAEQTVYHNMNYPSHIILPVIPSEG